MFAYAYFIIDKQLAKVPVGYIKKFELKSYDSEKVYKVFWSRSIHAIQNEKDSSSMSILRKLRDPPPKVCWKISEGERYYSAFILRVEDSWDLLIESLEKKRPTLPTQCENMTTSTTEDEAAVLQSQKGSKKKQEVEMKKHEQAVKRSRAEEIFKTAKRSRKILFRERNSENDSSESMEMSDSEGPDVIPKSKYLDLKKSYDVLEKEKGKVEKSYYELQKAYDLLKAEHEEFGELRKLNRRLQEKLLDMRVTQGECAGEIVGDLENPTDSETTEVELAAGLKIDKNVYKEIFSLDHVRKFTKSFAVAVWGTETLARRSVKGQTCKNRNGPKKVVEGSVPINTAIDAKPPLTPEKLAVISGQMRKFLEKQGKSAVEIESELKKRNRYISDKIQDVCMNMQRIANKNKSF